MNVLFSKEMNVSEINYGDIKPLGEKASIMYLNFKDQPIYIQTPLMKCPYGLSCFNEDPSSRPKYSLDLSFGSSESNSINELKNLINEIDNKLLDDSVSNGMTWLGKKVKSRDIADALFTKSVKYAIDKETGEPIDKYPPTIKLRVPVYQDNFKVQCYNDNAERLNSNDLPSLIPKGQSVRAIIKLQGVWFAGGKFGVKWEVSQLRLNPQSSIQEYAFIDEDENSEDINESSDKQSVLGDNAQEQNYVISSDDDL